MRLLQLPNSTPTTPLGTDAGARWKNEIAGSRLHSMKRYMCLICGFIYDEAEGLPEDGIAPGTRWEDLPPNWSCPECGARKEDFEMIEI
jgi:rubredoxin